MARIIATLLLEDIVVRLQDYTIPKSNTPIVGISLLWTDTIQVHVCHVLSICTCVSLTGRHEVVEAILHFTVWASS